MRTYVRNGSKFPTLWAIQPPIPVGGSHEPVLVIRAGYESDLSQGATADQLMRLMEYRVETNVEAGRIDHGRGSSSIDKLPTLLGIQAQRFLTDDVFAGLNRGESLRKVQIVGARDMDNINLGVPHQLLQGTIATRNSQLPSTVSRLFRRRTEEPDDLGTRTTSRFNMNRADEPGADDCNPNISWVGHRRLLPFTRA